MLKRSGKAGDLIPFARAVQLSLAKLFVGEGIRASSINTTLALDIAYGDDVAYCTAVKYDVRKRSVVRKWNLSSSVFFPYVPGYLYMREAPPLLRLLKRVDEEYDIMLVDAHGRLHPRKAGLATIVGVLAGRPSLGIAKSRLVGKVKEIEGEDKKERSIAEVHLHGELLGYRVARGKNAFYLSQGNMISIQEAAEFIRMRNYEYPEELLVADREARKFRENP